MFSTILSDTDQRVGKAGPSVILAYLLAGLLVLPAALSKAEMATAMPEAGGTYLYIDRAMGPLMGTIAGLGAWFSLVFKSAFVLLVLFAFSAEGAIEVRPGQFQPFFEKGVGGLLAATGFVLVSCAGVTKIASIAEEVEQPDRTLPLGILVSVGGWFPCTSSCTSSSGAPRPTFFTRAYPRWPTPPNSVSAISDRFRTPGRSILVTGGLLFGLIAFVPVLELAKLASASKILIFGITNVALIAFREGEVESYDPAFELRGKLG